MNQLGDFMIKSINKTPPRGKPRFRRDIGPVPTTFALIKFNQQIADLLLLEKVTYQDIINLQISVERLSQQKLNKDVIQDIAEYWASIDLESTDGVTDALKYFVKTFVPSYENEENEENIENSENIENEEI